MREASQPPLKRASLVLVLSFALATPHCTERTQVRPASVCQLRQQSHEFENATVQVTARIVSDFNHSTVLLDDRCLSTGVGLSFGAQKPDPKAVALLKYIPQNLQMTA